MAYSDHTSGKSPRVAGPVLRDAALGAGGRSEGLSPTVEGEGDAAVAARHPAEQADASDGLRMPQPEVRDTPDGGGIHWHEQVEPGIPEADGATDPH